VALLALLALTAACSEETDDPPSITPWDGTFDEPVARPEHPRPDFFRDTFVNLNTAWQFAYDPDDVGLDEGWPTRDDVWAHTIQLPYAWEAPLAGLTEAPEAYSPATTTEANTYRGVAWYRLQLPGPLPYGDDWYLVFGAVDFRATVWVDGVEVGSHQGGYAPFSVNLSAANDGGTAAAIVVRVEDWTELEDRALPVGKQGGTWYTRTSGIWQTVYLEQRPATHLTGLRVIADIDAGEVAVTPSFEGEGAVAVQAFLDSVLAGEATAEGASSEIRVPLDPVELWDVDHPTLYDLDVTLTTDGGADVVHSYFGLSQAGTGWLPGRSPDETDDPMQQAKSFTFNGEPVYLRCVLDQSYWPGGVYTAPSLDAIRADLETARDFGFNCVRLHIKPDEPVKYRLIDELGFYLVYDVPSLDMQAENTAGFVGREYFAETLAQTMERDANHPSLMLWVVFNENWGLSANGSLVSPTPLADDPDMQQWVREMVELTRSIDPTRPVEDNSAGGVVGAFEHLTGDSNSFHHYEDDAESWRDMLEEQAAVTYPGSEANYVSGAVQDGAPWWNSEFASFSFLGSSEDAFCDLFGALNELRRTPRLTGWVLTQLTDVEFEDNGLVAYDRTPKDDLCAHHDVALQDLLGDDFVGFDWEAGFTEIDDPVVEVPIWFSQWSSPDPRDLTLSVRWDDGDPITFEFTSAPLEITPIPGVVVDMPADLGDHVFVAEVLDGATRVCANRIDVYRE